MPKTRVLIVEDSLTVRARLREILESDPEFDVVGEAGDGQTGVELCQALRPDVVTLDMMLPVMTGLAATEHIMAYCPTPILVVSASTNRGEVFRTYEALAAGAVDVLDKPLGDEPADEWERQLVAAVKMVARIKIVARPRSRVSGHAPRPAVPPVPAARRSPANRPLQAVAIGVSTGGPAALCAILGQLPADFPFPILLVIHIGLPFAPAFADWLNDQSQLPVAFAQDGEALPTDGRVLLAPAEQHMVLRQGRIRLNRDPERYSCRPSIDTLFESVAHDLGPGCAACLLTGMGRDGAEGLLAIRRAGGFTIAQDEATSVVFGMPREAIQLGAAEQVLPLDAIAPALVGLTADAPRRRQA